MSIEEIICKYGKDILRFCRFTAGERDNGDDLYQDVSLVNGKLKSFLTVGNVFLTSDKNKKDPGLHTKFIDGKLVTYYEDGFRNIHKMF